MGRIIRVKVIPNSRADLVVDGDPLVVKVRAAPEKGKANLAVTKLLSKHFGAEARIIGGAKSRKKLVELKTKD